MPHITPILLCVWASQCKSTSTLDNISIATLKASVKCYKSKKKFVRLIPFTKAAIVRHISCEKWRGGLRIQLFTSFLSRTLKKYLKENDNRWGHPNWDAIILERRCAKERFFFFFFGWNNRLIARLDSSFQQTELSSHIFSSTFISMKASSEFLYVPMNAEECRRNKSRPVTFEGMLDRNMLKKKVPWKRVVSTFVNQAIQIFHEIISTIENESKKKMQYCKKIFLNSIQWILLHRRKCALYYIFWSHEQ